MSEELPPPTPKTAAIPPPSGSKTSAVPLKKETVRITLRARPGAGVTQPREATSPVPTISGAVPPPSPSRATAPVQLPSAPLPPPSPKAPTSPVSLPPAPIPPPGRKTMNVEVAAPTSPMAPSAPRPPAPSAPGAPRPPAPGAPRPPAPGTPRVETGAMTQPMAAAPRAPMAAAPRAPGSGTGPLGGAPTAALPKATQKLQATQPMVRPTISPAPPNALVKRGAADSEQFYDEKDPEAGLVPLSAVCLVLSILLLLAQMVSSDRVEGLTSGPGEESPVLVPQYEKVNWEDRDPDTHQPVNKFNSVLPELPQ